MRTNESGRSMIEMLGVLAIIGVLSVGGIAGYSKAMMKYKTNKVIDQVTMIVTNIRTLYAQQTTYDGLTTDTAIAMGVVPDELGTASGGMHNPFRGDVIIGPAKYSDSTAFDPSAKGAFFVTFTGLPKETCVNLATSDWGSGYSSGLVGIMATGASTNVAYTISGEAKDVISGALVTDVDSSNFVLTASVPCKGSSASGQVIACAGGATIPTPMQVSRAALGCSCTNNSPTCAVTWKYY